MELPSIDHTDLYPPFETENKCEEGTMPYMWYPFSFHRTKPADHFLLVKLSITAHLLFGISGVT
jgi:hypothetical protein